MKRENVDKWLRTEAENLGKEINQITTKIIKLMKNEDVNLIDKINQHNIKLTELKSAQFKLYEMLGRIDEIED